MTGAARIVPFFLALSVHGSPGSDHSFQRASAAAGTYVGTTLNRKPLPAEERVASSDDYSHWVKVERLLLRLQADGRFSVSMKYYHEHLRPKARPTGAQLLDVANRGTYSVHGEQIVFVPVSKDGKAPKPVSGKLHGDQIEVRFHIWDGDSWRWMTVVAVRDRSYW